jgi:hypothetical protein
MDLNLEQPILLKHSRTCVLVSLELLAKLLNLYREVIDDAPVIIRTAAASSCEFRRCELALVVEGLFFIGRIGFFLKEGRVNLHYVAVKCGCGILVRLIEPCVWIALACLMAVAR